MHNKTLSGKPAMNSARRDHVYGPIRGIDYDEPSYLKCGALGIAVSVLMFLAMVYVLPEVV